MKETKYLWWGSLLTLIMLIGYSFSSQAQDKKYPFVDTTYADIDRLEVNGRFCRVKIETVDNGSQVKMEGKIRGLNRKSRFEIMHEKIGKTLRVWIDDLSENSATFATKSYLHFKVPATIELDIKNTSGGIFASKLKGMEHRLRTTSGMINLQDVEAKKIIAKTTSGGIRLQNVTAAVGARATSGMVKAVNVKGDLSIRTSAGGIRLKNVEGGLQLKTSAAAIIGEQVLLTRNSTFRTSAGKIRMKFTNDIKKLNFDLKASAAKLWIGEERYRKRVILRNGQNIMVKGVSNAGSQRYESFTGK
ncbi:hypothetical protein BKI52_17055 [marine bacterium AO1-C]|nr:hypothetical protein BKI52_17055 [marine bacterium AO1-C]